MALQGSLIYGRSKNTAFLDVIKIALPELGRRMLLNDYGYNNAISINTAGYNANYKRNYLASKIITNPELYAESFARLLLIIDPNKMDEIDFNTIATDCSNQVIFDAIAGISLADINF